MDYFSYIAEGIKVVETFKDGASRDAMVGGGVQGGSRSKPLAPAADMRPYVRIVEQPSRRPPKFRYACEGRLAGSIPGANSTPDRRTYPTIEIVGYTGKVIIVVSCVTKDTPYKPHPHNLVGREHCMEGVFHMKMNISPEKRLVSFKNFGVQCVKRRDIEKALALREGKRIDPFKTGFSHKTQPQSIDLNAVRLCFQVFTETPDGEHRRALAPVVSNVIYDKKAVADIHILRTSCSSGSSRGGTEIILLCEKVTRDDTEVVLYEDRGDGTPPWEANATKLLVHKQVAIVVTTPPYRDPHTSEHVEVFIQLKRLSDNERSNSIPFMYIPEHQDMGYLKRKRQKKLATSLLQQIEQDSFSWNQDKSIKTEPCASPLHTGSPLRLNPHEHEQNHHENTYQHWAPDLDVPGPSKVIQNFNQDMQYLAPSYQVPMQVSGFTMSPQGHLTQSMSPRIQVMSPLSQVMSLQDQMSPRGQIMSPHSQVMWPRGQLMSPLEQLMSPHEQVMSPRGQVMLPQEQVMLPLEQVMSPQEQMMSPRGQVMSPQERAMLHLTLDTERSGMSPGMGHMSLYDGQESIEQPMESNSTSLTSLLMDRGGENFNSGEIAAILGLRPGDLSDSLHRLSTSDLLNPAELQ